MEFSNQFTESPTVIHLNNGTQSKTPLSVLKAIHDYSPEVEVNPTRSLFSAWEHLWKTQTVLAQFFGADPRDLFIRSNITVVLNEIILGIKLPKGSEILVSNLEYGAIVNVCRTRASRDGFELKKVELPATAQETSNITPQLLVEKIVSAFTPKTKILVLSHIMTGTGLKLPIHEIAKETKKRGILFCVDGAHGPGSTPIDLATLNDVDFYTGNLHKWFMGPKGTSFGWVNKRVQDQVEPLLSGWTSHEIPHYFLGFGGGNLFASRFLLSSTGFFPSYFAIEDAIQFWINTGPEKIFTTLNERQVFLKKQMQKVSELELVTPNYPELSGPLFSYALPDRLADMGFSLFETLEKKHGLIVGVPLVNGRMHLRLSPHIYNTEAEIEKAVDILSAFVRH